MNRRNFLGLFVSASAAVGLGLSPITEPASNGDYSIRYLEAFDVHHGAMVHRIDMTKGNAFALEVPKSVGKGIVHRNISRSQIVSVLKTMSDQEAAILALITQLPMDEEMRGVSWY